MAAHKYGNRAGTDYAGDKKQERVLWDPVLAIRTPCKCGSRIWQRNLDGDVVCPICGTCRHITGRGA